MGALRSRVLTRTETCSQNRPFHEELWVLRVSSSVFAHLEETSMEEPTPVKECSTSDTVSLPLTAHFS